MDSVEEKHEADEIDDQDVNENNFLSKLRHFFGDATNQSVLLQKTISFHQQYQTVFIEAAGYLEELERKLETFRNDENFGYIITQLQVCVLQTSFFF